MQGSTLFDLDPQQLDPLGHSAKGVGHIHVFQVDRANAMVFFQFHLWHLDSSHLPAKLT